VSLDISTIDLGYLATPEGTAAFEQAKRWPPAVDATLVVVNTGRNGDYSPPNFASPQDLDAIRGELTEAGIEHQILQPTDGKPAAEAIHTAAVTHAADLIVNVLHRRTPAGKLSTGSTAQHELLDAGCPVQTVKAPH
jgi:nucleotide-binding universal stress UspA family protein